jgi:hypothetical protein
MVLMLRCIDKFSDHYIDYYVLYLLDFALMVFSSFRHMICIGVKWSELNLDPLCFLVSLRLPESDVLLLHISACPFALNLHRIGISVAGISVNYLFSSQ